MADPVMIATMPVRTFFTQLARAPGSSMMLRTYIKGIQTLMKTWNRLGITIEELPPDEPTLYIANHGWGGAPDLSPMAAMIVIDDLGGDRDLAILIHDINYTVFGAGYWTDHIGTIPGSMENALNAFAQGKNILLLPGGDRDGLKPFKDRNKVNFFGNHGFVELARRAGVPIVPIVTAGAGETLYGVDGTKLAQRLKLDKTARLNSVPISVSIPWGVNVGFAGVLPWFPLPSKLETIVLPSIRVKDDDDVDEFALALQERMQQEMDKMTKGRIPIVGRLPWRKKDD